jgi:hypothetical protein
MSTFSKRPHVPTYRLHKATGQAIVTLPDGNGDRRDVYLGVHDTEESRRASDPVISEWMANGRRPARAAACPGGLSINELVIAYWRWAETYYRHPDGTATTEREDIRLALRRLREMYGDTDADAFNGLSLETLRERKIAEGLCRGRINRDVARVKRAF